MNTSQIECFVRVADTLNFQRAAESLHISQPAASKQIAALENELGAQLLIRTTRTVYLTPAGKRFLEDARNILTLIHHSRQTIADSKKNLDSILRIGYSDTCDLVGLVDAFRKMRALHGQFQPEFLQGSWEQNLTRLEQGQIDLCFGLQHLDAKGFARFLPLTDGRFVCVLPKTHPLAQQSSITYEQLRGEPQVLCIPLPLRTAFYETKGNRRVPFETDTQITLCSNTMEAYVLVLAGYGYCLLPENLIIGHAGLCFLEWESTRDFVHGIYYPDNIQSPMLRDFIKILQGVYWPEEEEKKK